MFALMSRLSWDETGCEFSEHHDPISLEKNVISVCLNKRGQCFLTFTGNQGHKHHAFADTLSSWPGLFHGISNL